jgi:hypothetical protein
VPAAEFLALELEAHRVMQGVPLHDVSAVDLPGGGPDRTLADLRALLAGQDLAASSRAVRALFALRFRIGAAFGWDAEEKKIAAHEDASFARRVDAELASRSAVRPGTLEGRFRTLYLLPRESLAEIRNATVHGALATALVPAKSGYRLYWAVYVAPVSRWTPLYMAAIEPFRRLVVYPAILGRIRSAWIARYAARA